MFSSAPAGVTTGMSFQLRNERALLLELSNAKILAITDPDVCLHRYILVKTLQTRMYLEVLQDNKKYWQETFSCIVTPTFTIYEDTSIF